MKQIFLITLVLALVSSSLFSQRVSKEDALKVGMNFYKHKAKDLNLTKSSFSVNNYHAIKSSTNEEIIHTFNFEDGGFIMVGGNMVATPVLAYSFDEPFDMENMAPATREWINSYAAQIEKSIELNDIPNEQISKAWEDYSLNKFSSVKSNGNGVMPLIQTKWDQGKYYNYYCPTHPLATAANDYKVPTGCVATAMAQVMKYYNYPEIGKGYGYYYWGEHITIDFNEARYNWDKMPARLNSSVVTNDSATMFAVAELMFHSGISVFMDYGATESGSSLQIVPSAMKDNFRYRSGVEYRDRALYPDAEWMFALRNELDLGRPVLYRGNDKDGYGHAFVCDGYQGENFFHFNWGWSGANDGFFNLNPVVGDNPLNNTITYYVNQGAIFNLSPSGAAGANFPFCKGEVIIPFTEGSFDDGSGPNRYFYGTNCQWLITMEDIDPELSLNFDSIRIMFNKFELTEGAVLTIYDGNNSDAPVLARLDHKSRVPGNISTPGKNLFFTFVTREEAYPGEANTNGNGWEINYTIVQKSPASVDNNTLSNLTMFPNPASDVLNINGLSENVSVKIYDIYGRQHVDINKLQDHSINISNLSAGVYFVKIEGKNSNRTMKFIKE